MNCDVLKQQKIDQIIELYSLRYDEFKTKLKTSTDVETMINAYTTIYVYIAARKQVLQILGNYKEDRPVKDKNGDIEKDENGNPVLKAAYTKDIIYNYQKKKHKDIDEFSFMEIYSQLLEFCAAAEQLIMLKKIEEEEEEIKKLQSLSSNRIDNEKIRKFLEE